MDKGENCPVCSELGRSGILQLRNINDSEAIYVCNNTECPFPVGLSDKIAENVIPSLLPESEQDQEEREASDQEESENTAQIEQFENRIIVEDVNIFLDPEDNTLLSKLMDEL